MAKKSDYIEHPWLKYGLIMVCDVCGKPLLKHQRLGKKAYNDALCHQKCLYYKIGKRIVTYNELVKHITKKYKKCNHSR